MQAKSFALLCSAVFAATAAEAADEPVTYRLTPEIDAGSLTALDVEIGLRADSSGRMVIDLPDAGTDQHSRWRFMSDVTAEGAAMREDGPAKRVLTSAPGAQITLRYRVRSAYEAEPKGEDGNPYSGAIILPTWFAALGDFVFLAPEGRDQAPAAFQWGPLPTGWVVASDLDRVPASSPLTVSDVVNSTMIGGPDVRIVRRPLQRGELRVAIRGAWAFPEERLADDIATIIDMQRRFWGEESGPYFVDIVPLATSPHGASVGGTGKFNGFALYGTSNADESVMRRILAHEHTHDWIPGRQGQMPDGPQEAAAYWYSEGLTDFYTDRTLLRSGVWTTADFVSHLNQVLRAYDTSPVHTAPNSRIVSDFSTDQHVQQLPYQRGYLLAFIWDHEVRLGSRDALNLDPVMFAMRARYEAAPAEAKPELIANFERAARDVAHADLRPDIERFAVRGEPISLPADLFESCATVATVTIPVFDAGFDLAASRATKTFAGVDPTGPAYRAGIREGMKVLGATGGDATDSRVQITYRVRDQNGAERVISYRPEGKTTISFQQVELAERARRDPAFCTAEMSGRPQAGRER